MDLSRTQVELVSKAYEKIIKNIEVLRERKNSPLTLSEKLLFGHAKDVTSISLDKGEDFGDFLPESRNARCNSANGYSPIYAGRIT